MISNPPHERRTVSRHGQILQCRKARLPWDSVKESWPPDRLQGERYIYYDRRDITVIYLFENGESRGGHCVSSLLDEG